MNQLWFEDIMNQSFHEDICFNPTKLIILSGLCRSNELCKEYRIYDIATYVYRVYADNPIVACKHPSYMIRNISSYGVRDIEEHVVDSLSSWCRDARNDILHFNKSSLWLNIDPLGNEDIIADTNKLTKMIYKKKFGGDIPKVEDESMTIVLADDHDLINFGQGPYRRRVLEDIQYCPICEEIHLENLVAVHIVEQNMGASDADLIDKNNGLIMCKQHAQMYIDNVFYFDDLGFAHCDSNQIERGTHLSFVLRTDKRKAYLKKRLLFLRGGQE